MEAPTQLDLEADANPGNILIGVATGYILLVIVAVYSDHWWQMRKIRKRRARENKEEKPRKPR